MRDSRRAVEELWEQQILVMSMILALTALVVHTLPRSRRNSLVSVDIFLWSPFQGLFVALAHEPFLLTLLARWFSLIAFQALFLAILTT